MRRSYVDGSGLLSFTLLTTQPGEHHRKGYSHDAQEGRAQVQRQAEHAEVDRREDEYERLLILDLWRRARGTQGWITSAAAGQGGMGGGLARSCPCR